MNSQFLTSPVDFAGRASRRSELRTPTIEAEHAARADHASFDEILARSRRNEPDARLERSRDVAAKFVGAAFIQPLLSQMRESPFAVEPFAPTTTERRFGPMMDAMLADRIAKASNFDLTDAVVRHLTREATDA